MTPEQLFEENIRYASYAVTKYQGLGEPDELLHLARVGMFKAALNFDASLGYAFVTYANFYIKREIVKTYENDNYLKISRNVREAMSYIYTNELQDMPAQEIASRSSYSVNDIKRALVCMEMSAASLDAPAFDNEGPMTHGERVAGTDDSEWDNNILFKDFFSSLDEREQKVVKLRLEDMSQLDVSHEIGISQMHVSRILKRIRAKYELFLGMEEVM